jgi:hypothetical protein
MIIGLAVAVLAAAFAKLRGGSLRSIAETEFRWTWLVFVGFIVQFGMDLWDPDSLSESGSTLVLVWTNAAIVVFLVLNRHLPGMLLAGVGLAANLVVIVANGAMPVSLEAARIAGIGTSLTQGIGHEPMTSATTLSWLGDVIPLPGLGLVISPGDIVLAGGLAWLAYSRAFAGVTEASD